MNLVIAGAGAPTKNALLTDGSRAGSTAQAQDFGTNGIKADVVAESTGAAGVTVDGVLIQDGIVESVTRADIGDGNILVLGDSMASTLVNPLQTALDVYRPGVYTVINGTIGGENIEQCVSRFRGCDLVYPIAGTDSPAAGAVNLIAREANLPRLYDDAYSAEWSALRGKISPITAVHFWDRNTYLGAARRRVYIGRRTGNSLMMYKPISSNEGPGGSWLNSAGEDGVIDTSSLLNATLTQSEDYVLHGRYASKVTASATGSFGILQDGFSGAYPASIEAWVYIPVGSAIPSVGFYNLTGTSAGSNGNASTSTKGAWQKIEWIWIPGGASFDTVTCGYNGAADCTGASFYIEDIRITGGWLPPSASTDLVDDQRIWCAPIGSGALPTGLSAYRTYFIKTTGTVGYVELAKTSGGASITLSANGFCYVYGDWVLPVTFTAEQAANYNISIRPVSIWNNRKTVVFIGHNPGTATIDSLLNTYGFDPAKMIYLGLAMGATAKKGTAAYNNTEWLTARMTEDYPNHVIDTLSLLLDAGSGSGQDLLDVGNGVVPTSLRVDSIHLGDGAVVVSDAIVQKIDELLW